MMVIGRLRSICYENTAGETMVGKSEKLIKKRSLSVVAKTKLHDYV